MRNIKIYYLLLICILVLFSCEKDPEAMLTQLRVVKEQFTPSYTSIEVECQLSTSASINDVYVQYATSQDFADYQEEEMQKKDGMNTVNLSNLEDNTTYYIRYAASNRYSTATTKDFSTAKTLAPNHPSVDVVSITDVLDKSANVQFDLTFDGGASVTELGVCYGTSNNPSVENDKKIAAKDNQTTISLTSLQENTTYYVRAYAKNKVGVAYSESITFTTLTQPKVQTNDISNIQLTSATLNAVLLSNGNDSAVTKGFCWSEISNPTITSLHTEVQNTTSSFCYQLSNLKAETKYYVRAYAKNKIGVVYGEEKSFTTKSALIPTITTSSVTDISYTSATVGGNVTNDGGAEVTERGVVYSTSQNPTTSNSKVQGGTGTGSFTCSLTNLQEGITYYVRAYATNQQGTAYGEQKTFTTKAYALPTVTTSFVTDISYTSATVGGNVTNDGGAEVTERGVVYSTSSNPTTSNSKVTSGSGMGSFTCNITNLQEGTTYYVRAYAVNEKGTAYGEQKSFTTSSIALPTVTTSSVTNITYNSATVGGNVTSDGGASVTERGICYSTTEHPTTESTKIISGKGTGDYTANLTGLQDSTTYYVRAYAVNKKGTAYGEQVSFMTKGYKLPTITTANPTNVEYTSATVGGNISSDGGAEVTERGICYSTSKNLTIEDTKIVSGNGTSNYTINLTDLQDTTTYYVRAYAINKKGIAFGEQVSFTTKRCKLPSITTIAPTNISYASVTVGGNVTSDGGAEVTERGICFSPSSNPTIENSKILIGKGVGEYIVDLTNLSECTTYYIRAYAINKMGINYGQEISVTTLKAPFENGYEYVDLGLSVKWATMNIGSSYPEEYGNYFAFEKWSSELASWGGNWCVPTESNIMELQTNCNWEWTKLNGVYGYKVTSKVYGYKDQSIFLPAAGYFTIDFFDVGTDGYYWSSSRHPYDSSYACHFHFSSNGIGRTYTRSLSYKYPIRLVCP